MTRCLSLFACIALGLLTVGCQSQNQSAPKSDPAYELQQSQAYPVPTPIPSSASDEPIVITELPPNEAASLSDGMINDTPAQPLTPPTPKPQIVVEEPDVTNTTPMMQQAQPQMTETVTVDKGPSYTALARAVYTAHGGWRWGSKHCIQADIQLTFGGKVRLVAKLLTDKAAGKVRLTLNNGTVLVYDGTNVWMSPANAPVDSPRFDALTWSYFLAAPFKLGDKGTHLKNLGPQPFIAGQSLPAAKLTFNAGVGDSPDDWYIAYVDPNSRWLRGMAYIVTYGKSVEKAEQNPHAITYDNYVRVNGVYLPRTWNFWNWSQEQGITGNPIGSALLSNIQMVQPAANSFTQPEGGVLCTMPQ